MSALSERPKGRRTFDRYFFEFGGDAPYTRRKADSGRVQWKEEGGEEKCEVNENVGMIIQSALQQRIDTYFQRKKGKERCGERWRRGSGGCGNICRKVQETHQEKESNRRRRRRGLGIV